MLGRGGTGSDGVVRVRALWTDDVLPARLVAVSAVGYDRTRVASAGRRWTAQTVRRVHGMEEVRGSIPLSSTTRNRRSAACKGRRVASDSGRIGGTGPLSVRSPERGRRDRTPQPASPRTRHLPGVPDLSLPSRARQLAAAIARAGGARTHALHQRAWALRRLHLHARARPGDRRHQPAPVL